MASKTTVAVLDLLSHAKTCECDSCDKRFSKLYCRQLRQLHTHRLACKPDDCGVPLCAFVRKREYAARTCYIANEVEEYRKRLYDMQGQEGHEEQQRSAENARGTKRRRVNFDDAALKNGKYARHGSASEHKQPVVPRLSDA
jgi:hypothetical protein